MYHLPVSVPPTSLPTRGRVRSEPTCLTLDHELFKMWLAEGRKVVRDRLRQRSSQRCEEGCSRGGPCPKKGDCPADFDEDGSVGVKDLLALLAGWGQSDYVLEVLSRTGP